MLGDEGLVWVVLSVEVWRKIFAEGFGDFSASWSWLVVHSDMGAGVVVVEEVCVFYQGDEAASASSFDMPE